MNYYAGIGSRKTPEAILSLMSFLASKLEEEDWIARSGGADGADKAFSDGCKSAQVFVPWNGFGGFKQTYKIPQNAFDITAPFHPAWVKLPNTVRTLMARNAMQILGPSLCNPSKFALCWTPDGAETGKDTSYRTGGTGQAIRIASHYNVPVINLQKRTSIKRLLEIGDQLNIETFAKHKDDIVLYLEE